MRIGTKVIRAGMRPRAQGEPFLGGVTFAGTYRAAGDPATSPYTYGRYHNPTWTEFERALGELEDGSALSFASGMAAVAAETVEAKRHRTNNGIRLLDAICMVVPRRGLLGEFHGFGIPMNDATAVDAEITE